MKDKTSLGFSSKSFLVVRTKYFQIYLPVSSENSTVMKNESENIICHYADNLALASKTHYSRKVKGKDVINNFFSRQFYYFDHFFIKIIL